MTLGQKLTLTIAAQLVGVAVVGGIGLRGFTRLRTALEQTTDQFGALRTIHRVGHHAVMARTLVQMTPSDLAGAHQQIDNALRSMEEPPSMDHVEMGSFDDPEARVLRAALENAASDADPHHLASDATVAIAAVQSLAQRIQRDVRAQRGAAIAINDRAAYTLFIAGAVIVLASALVGICQQRSVMRPLRSLRLGVDRLRRGDFSGSVACGGDQEFAALAARFNEMAHQLRRARDTLEQRVKERTTLLIRSERLARLGVLAAGFAHEINNPLAIIRGHAELALRHRNGDSPRWSPEQSAHEMAEALHITLEEIDRSQRVLERLQSLGVNDPVGHTDVSVHDLIILAVGLVEPIAQQAGCVIQYRCSCDPAETRARGDGSEITQIIINLLLNAIDATRRRGDGMIDLCCARRARTLSIDITDNGIGMSRDMLSSAFDPFVSGTGGTGLGLAVCQAIADRHGASLLARSDGVGAGSVFSLLLRAYAVEEAA